MASRHVEVSINGDTWCMPATYAVSKKIHETVGDPLRMTISASQGAWPWTAEDVISILYIGLQAAGCKMKRSEVAEKVFEDGAINFVKIVAKYISELVSGGPERALREEDIDPKD